LLVRFSLSHLRTPPASLDRHTYLALLRSRHHFTHRPHHSAVPLAALEPCAALPSRLESSPETAPPADCWGRLFAAHARTHWTSPHPRSHPHQHQHHRPASESTARTADALPVAIAPQCLLYSTAPSSACIAPASHKPTPAGSSRPFLLPPTFNDARLRRDIASQHHPAYNI
jgi:hypothetical protein